MTTKEQIKERYADAKQLAAYFGVSVITIRRWEAAGILPPAVRLGRRLKRWDMLTMENYLHDASRQAERR